MTSRTNNPLVGPKFADTSVPSLALRCDGASRATGLSEGMIRMLVKRKAIPHKRVGTCIVFPVDQLRRWLNDGKDVDSGTGENED
jgi:hypothetical protein